MAKLANDSELKFLSEQSPHLSSFAHACDMQDLREGTCDTRDSAMKALVVTSEIGIAPLKQEAEALLIQNSRACGTPQGLSADLMVTFSAPRQSGCSLVTGVKIKGFDWMSLTSVTLPL